MIHAENAEKFINEIIDGLPPYMEEERAFLRLVRESVLNHVIWAYSNKPNEKHDHDLWHELIGVLRKYKK